MPFTGKDRRQLNDGREGYWLLIGEEGPYGSFEVYWNGDGWCWHTCFPGCMPDGDPSGPFDSSDEAYRDALDKALTE